MCRFLIMCRFLMILAVFFTARLASAAPLSIAFGGIREPVLILDGDANDLDITDGAIRFDELIGLGGPTDDVRRFRGRVLYDPGTLIPAGPRALASL